jgi:hypothetical protein
VATGQSAKSLPSHILLDMQIQGVLSANTVSADRDPSSGALRAPPSPTRGEGKK